MSKILVTFSIIFLVIVLAFTFYVNEEPTIKNQLFSGILVPVWANPSNISFLNSTLDEGTGVLTITFDKIINATSIDSEKIYIREEGSTNGGITLSSEELITINDSETISFELTETNRQTVIALNIPHLTIDDEAVKDTSGNVFSAPFDISNASLNESFSVRNDGDPYHLAFSSNGEKLFVLMRENFIFQYSLTTPFDISTANSTFNALLSLDDDGKLSTSLTFSNDGYKMFVADASLRQILEYTLVKPFDISNATYNDINLDIVESTKSLAFSPDGTKMFVGGTASDTVYEYQLDTSFDLSTASSSPVNSIYVGGTVVEISGMSFSSDGEKMFVTDRNSDTLYQYALTTPFDILTAAYDDIYLELPDRNPSGPVFSTDGTKMFIAGYQGDRVIEYTLNVFDIETTFDAREPEFQSSTLDENTGIFSITFDETIDATPTTQIDLAKLFISETGNADEIVLSGASITTEEDSSTISITLTNSQKALVSELDTPQLDIEEGAVTDISGNSIDETSDNAISISVCSISISSALDFGKTFVDKTSSETSIVISNDGNIDTQIFISGEDWKSVINDDTQLLVIHTKYHITSGLSFDSMISLSETETDTGLVVTSGSSGTLYFKVKNSLVDPDFIGDISQNMTIAASC